MHESIQLYVVSCFLVLQLSHLQIVMGFRKGGVRMEEWRRRTSRKKVAISYTKKPMVTIADTMYVTPAA
jgi:1,4-alpha-glucan branching enzyme